MIVGAAIVPTAPLLVRGVSKELPAGVPKVCAAVSGALDSLAPADCAVLVAAGPGAVHAARVAGLAGVGRPDVCADVQLWAGADALAADGLGLPLDRDEALPLGLSVLCLLLGRRVRALLPVSVRRAESFQTLTEIGRAITDRTPDESRIVVVAAGDLSAGLTEKSPLWRVPGALFWDEQAAAAVDSGRLGSLSRLGPEEAQRVGALGWAPMVVLHGAVASAKIGMVVRHYSAPRGVGYLVASG
jgi:hypothetical protein